LTSNDIIDVKLDDHDAPATNCSGVLGYDRNPLTHPTCRTFASHATNG
jgi:hypothetical protein